MTLNLDEIRPQSHQRVMDLVAEAGLDVSDWGNYKKGPEHAASNPKYCYEWAFVEQGKQAVLCLWYSNMQVEGDSISQRLNFRRLAIEMARVPSNGSRAKRAEALDKAIQDCARDGLSIRVIVCDGEMRDAEDENSKASRVHQRLLDSEPWTVKSYDWDTGEAVLVRGAHPKSFADQFSLTEEDNKPKVRTTKPGEVYVRDAAVRNAALERSEGFCELCGESGFATPDGRIYLETHHVIPLSEDGPDVASNVIALCANHHREAHYGADKAQIRLDLLAKLRDKS